MLQKKPKKVKKKINAIKSKDKSLRKISLLLLQLNQPILLIVVKILKNKMKHLY